MLSRMLVRVGVVATVAFYLVF